MKSANINLISQHLSVMTHRHPQRFFQPSLCQDSAQRLELATAGSGQGMEYEGDAFWREIGPLEICFFFSIWDYTLDDYRVFLYSMY